MRSSLQHEPSKRKPDCACEHRPDQVKRIRCIPWRWGCIWVGMGRKRELRNKHDSQEHERHQKMRAQAYSAHIHRCIKYMQATLVLPWLKDERIQHL